MELSIILVNHNAKKMTIDCIFSILAKTHGSYEIILIDNASTDNSIQAIKRKFPNVTIIANAINYGFAQANNQGIRRAQGKYVALLNNDTLLKNNAFDKMCAFMDKNPQVGVGTCKLFDGDGKTIQRNCRSFPTPIGAMFGRTSLLTKILPNNPISKRNLLSDWNYNSLRNIDWASGAMLLIRQEVLEQIGLLDDNFFMYWEDTDFCKRAKEADWRICFFPEAEIIHFVGGGGGGRALRLKLYTMFQMHRSAYYYFLKHHFSHIFEPLAIITFMGLLILVAFKGFIETLLFLCRKNFLTNKKL